MVWRETGLKLTDLIDTTIYTMNATGLEVVQSVQDLQNSVTLVSGKRTFVRFHAAASGKNVPNVTAYLYRTDAGGNVTGGPLKPINNASGRLTVRTNPSRANIDEGHGPAADPRAVSRACPPLRSAPS